MHTYLCALIAGVLAIASAESRIYTRVMTVDIKDPVILDVAVANGDVTIAYNRDGQVAVYAFTRDAAGAYGSRELFESMLTVQQTDNHVTVHTRPGAHAPEGVHISYKIDVPLRTQVVSTVSGIGSQIVMGITGPATITSGEGDIDARYISEGLLTARTRLGRVSCIRVNQLDVETEGGTITLMENGPSVAAVKHGAGRIDIGGARGAVRATTDKGGLSIKAVPWDTWELASNSGAIRIAVPSKAKFDLDVTSNSGDISIERQDVARPGADTRQCKQSVNGGGKRIQARTASGTISIE